MRYLESRIQKPTKISSKYSIGPFLKGHSIIIFNIMRTVMLANLVGIAIIAVHIKGINHEFSITHNTEEDVMSILLNIKELILRSDNDLQQPILIKSKVTGPGLFLAKDIQLPSNISFVDSRQYIATLTSNSDLELEFIIAKGQDYVTSGRLTHLVPKNFIALDGIFMPVTSVFFYTELLRTSRSFSIEIAILEICTNGTLVPTEALQFSSEILKCTFDYLLNLKFSEKSSSYTANSLLTVPKKVSKNFVKATPLTEKERKLKKNIHSLNLRTRASRCLSTANIKTIGDLVKYSKGDILGLPTCGIGTLKEIETKLKDVFDLKLRTL